MASFDRAIPPGGVGKITLSVRTEGYQAQIRKTARVYTNDPSAKETALSLKAFVKAPIYLVPRYVNLSGLVGERVIRTMEIRAGLDKPLELSPESFSLEGKLSYTVEEVDKGRKFIIRFNSIPLSEQSYQGFLKLKTNYPEKPTIEIKIRGRFVKAKKSAG